jgi:hypothetical protein
MRTMEELTQALAEPIWHLLRAGEVDAVAALLSASATEAGSAWTANDGMTAIEAPREPLAITAGVEQLELELPRP